MEAKCQTHFDLLSSSVSYNLTMVPIDYSNACSPKAPPQKRRQSLAYVLPVSKTTFGPKSRRETRLKAHFFAVFELMRSNEVKQENSQCSPVLHTSTLPAQTGIQGLP